MEVRYGLGGSVAYMADSRGSFIVSVVKLEVMEKNSKTKA
jgi:hypothetical protein